MDWKDLRTPKISQHMVRCLVKARYTEGFPVCFLHIPKCAGTSLRLGLEQSFGQDTVYRYYLPDAVGGASDPAFVTGHIDYDWLIANFPNGNLFTFVREPLARLISQYHFDVRYFRSRSDSKGNVNFGNGDPVSEIMSSRLLYYDNCMTRLISGAGWGVPFGELTDEHLKRALGNLERFFFVGFADRFEMDCKELGRILGMPINCGHTNIGEYGDSRMTISSEALPLLDLDDQLWQALIAERGL